MLQSALEHLVKGIVDHPDDVKVVSGSDVVWQKDVKLKKTQFVDVQLPAKTETKDDLPEGDLTPPNEELPEGDAEG